jgi:hypothetical protein
MAPAVEFHGRKFSALGEVMLAIAKVIGRATPFITYVQCELSDI